MERKLSPAELCFTPEHNLSAAYARFADKYGYPATEYRIALGLLRLGPIYSIHSAASQSLQRGTVVLVAGAWHEIADIDGSTVLDTQDNLLELDSIVKVRS